MFVILVLKFTLLFSKALWASRPMMFHSIFGGDTTLAIDALS